MKKLELESLQSELAGLDQLLAQRTRADDPLGWMQLSHLREDVLERIARIEGALPRTAEVAVFFGGTPVVGSRGIRADFAADALEHYQELVSKRMASSTLGPLAARGRIPMRDVSNLLVTDVVRGSFGFVLEEAGDANAPMIATALHQAVDDVSTLLNKIAAEDYALFEEAAETLDGRTLAAVRDFLRLLDDNGATLRVVEGQRDLNFDRASLHRGRERADATGIEEQVVDKEGLLFLFPDARRFELHTLAGEVIRGSVSVDALRRPNVDVEDAQLFAAADVVGRRWRLQVRERVVRPAGDEPRSTFTLLRLLENLGQV